ncbi:MAG: DUF3108 domain-containing protein [Flavobacteriales bacterium]|nr:DUF3108 domain-containing protein [Flavobacteriales bacterium]
MRALTTYLTFAILFIGIATAQGYRDIFQDQYAKGERLLYRVHYGFIDAGEVLLEIKFEDEQIDGRDVFHMVGLGYSTGMFDWFYKVEDRYETYIDATAVVPLKFIRRVNEGGYKIERDIEFKQLENTAIDDKGEHEVPDNVQDLLSAFYYARCLDFDNATVGDIFPINTFLDHEVFNMSVKYLGKEVIENDAGTFNCIKIRPMLQEGRVFKEEEDMTIWVSDDKNHIPIRLQTNVVIGSIRMDLMEFSGLVNSLARIKR